MRMLVIADTHFGHQSLAEEHQARPVDFEARIVRNWRRMVREDDVVIHLGDVVVGNATDWVTTIPNLPGRKVLVLGNHDRNTQSWYLTNGFGFCCASFVWQMYGLRIAFSHEPMLDGAFDLNIHGHLHVGRHGEYETDTRHYLFSLERSGYEPRTIESIVKEWTRGRRKDEGDA